MHETALLCIKQHCYVLDIVAMHEATLLLDIVAMHEAMLLCTQLVHTRCFLISSTCCEFVAHCVQLVAGDHAELQPIPCNMICEI